LFAVSAPSLHPPVQLFKFGNPTPVRGAEMKGSPRIFTPDGKRLLVATQTGLEVLDVETMKPTGDAFTIVESRQQMMGPIQVSSDGRWLLDMGSRGTAKLWRLDRTGQTPPSAALSVGKATSGAFSPTNLMVVSTEPGFVHLFEVQTGQRIGSLPMPDATPRLAKVVPGSPTLVLVASGARNLSLYDARRIVRLNPDIDSWKNRSDADLWKLIVSDASTAYAAALLLDERKSLHRLAEQWIDDSMKSRAVSDKIRSLVTQLSDEDDKKREAAHLELERVGKKAIPQLREAAITAEFELADRIAALLRLAGDEDEDPAAPEDSELVLDRVVEVLGWSNDPLVAKLKEVRPALPPTTRPAKPPEAPKPVDGEE
jgi:hypothetical protein